MRKQDYLLHLINSLEPNEKRYFKRFSGLQAGGQLYLKLFDALEGKEQYEPAEIAKKLKITSAKLAHEKEYLQTVLLRSLQMFHEKGKLYTELQHELLEAQILHDKYLVPFATSYTESLAERCELYEAYPTLLPALGILVSCYYMQGNMQQVEATNKRLAQAMKHYNEYIELATLRNRLLNYSHTLLSARENELAAIEAHPNFQRSQESIETFSGQLLWLDIQRTFLKYGNGSREKLLQFSEKRAELFEVFPQFKKAKTYLYYSTLYMLATDYSAARRHLDGIATIDKILELYAAGKPDKILEGFTFTGQINKMGMLVYSTQYEAAYHLGHELVKQFMELQNNSDINQQYFHAIAAFHLGHYQEAFDLCEVINQTYTDAFLPTQFKSRLLAGICQYMLGNHVTAVSHLKAAKGWGKRHQLNIASCAPLFTMLEHLATQHGGPAWKAKRDKLAKLIADNKSAENITDDMLGDLVFSLGLERWVEGLK